MGVDTMVYLDLNGEEICARSEPTAVQTVGDAMNFTIDMSHMHLIDSQTNHVV